MQFKSFMEALKGNQHKLDKNKNGKLDAHDFKLLRKEEDDIEEDVDRLTRSDYKISPSGRKSHKQIVFKDGEPESDEDKAKSQREEFELEENDLHTQMAAFAASRGGKLTTAAERKKTTDDLMAKRERDRATQPKPAPQKLTPYKPLGGRDEKSGRSYSEEQKPPFDGPYTKTKPVKNSDGTTQNPMSRARELAKQAMKKKMKEEFDLDMSDEQVDSILEYMDEEVDQIDELSKIPKGYHKMPDGTIMKDSDHKEELKAARSKQQGVTEGSAEAPVKHHTVLVSYHKKDDPHRRYEARFKTTHNLGKEETEKRAKAAFAAKGKVVYNTVHEQVVAEGRYPEVDHMPGRHVSRAETNKTSKYTVATNAKDGHKEHRVKVDATSENHARNLAGDHFVKKGLKPQVHFDGVRVVKEEVELEENHLMDYRRYTQAAKNAKAKGDHDIAKDAEQKASKSAANYTRVTGKKPAFNEDLEEGNFVSEKLKFSDFIAKINEQLLEYDSDDSGVYRHTKKATYGTSYQGDDDEDKPKKSAVAPDAPKRGRGRPAGSTGASYKPRSAATKAAAAAKAAASKAANKK